MNKTELVAAIAEKAEITKKDAEKSLNAVVASITDALVNGDKVQIVGFGTFEVAERAEREMEDLTMDDNYRFDHFRLDSMTPRELLWMIQHLLMSYDTVKVKRCGDGYEVEAAKEGADNG